MASNEEYGATPFRDRYPAALGLSWRQRFDAGHAIDVPCIDFGAAVLVLLPAESFVQYQLWAQELRPDATVLAMGYGECAPGYIPTAKDAAEGYDDYYSWVAFPECESTIRSALRDVLTPDAQTKIPALHMLLSRTSPQRDSQ
jgi:hypothetical protein